MKYRKDSRNKIKFAADIKDSTDIEQRLIQLYIAFLNKTTKSVWTYKDRGVDNSGSLIEDDRKVTTSADFEIFENGKSIGLFDIKFARKLVRDLHLKENHLASYIKQNAGIILFMNAESDHPCYVVLEVLQLEDIINNCKRVFFWQKWCRKLLVKDYTWTQL